MIKKTSWIWAPLFFISVPAVARQTLLMENSFESPLFIAHAQHYDDKTHGVELTYTFMQGRHEQKSDEAKTKFDVDGRRMGLITALRVADFPVMAGLALLDSNVRVDSNRVESLVNEAILSKGRSTTDDLEISPFVVVAPLASLRLGLTLAAHDYTIDTTRLYVQGASELRLTSPTYKRGYKQVVPSVVYGDGAFRLIGQYEPTIAIRDDYGSILVPASIRLGGLWAVSERFRLDAGLRHLRYSEFYTTDRNQVELTLGSRILLSEEDALAGYLAYAPDYARNDASLSINNIENIRATVFYEHQQGNWGTWGFRCGAENGYGWTKLTSPIVTKVTYRAKRYEGAFDVTHWF